MEKEIAEKDIEEKEEKKVDEPKKPEVNYVKQRVDRAKENTEKNILEELGVEDLSIAKKKLEDGAKALEKIELLETKLAEQEKQKEFESKKSVLIKTLDNHNVFDSEALANYVDIEKLKIEDGNIVDEELVIDGLKKVKPKFFAEYVTKSDNYVKGDMQTPTTPLDKQKSGDVKGALNDYLKQIL